MKRYSDEKWIDDALEVEGGNFDYNHSDHGQVIRRINEIIATANMESMGGRNQNYFRGGGKKRSTIENLSLVGGKRDQINRNYQYIDPQTGLTHLSQSADGYNLQTNLYPEGKAMRLDYGGNNMYGSGSYGHDLSYEGAGAENCVAVGRGYTVDALGGNLVDALGGCQGSGRKVRSDKGKKRGPNAWHRLVKAVAAAEGIPYNQALKVASRYKKEGYVAEDFE